jgi:protoheme IX farnesyltransferase
MAALRDYALVAKPGITAANLVTAAGGSFLAARGSPDLWPMLWTALGISLVVASSCVFNNLIDRDLDGRMARTRGRALARGALAPSAAVLYGLCLGVAGAALLVTTAGALSFAIVLGGFIIYVCIYSLGLKRSSLQGILIGSLAGAAPPLAGYCAVSGRFDRGAAILLSIFLLWQIPHSYAVALYRFQDYATAGIPVLPATPERSVAGRRIAGYILAFTGAALAPTLCGYTGYGYLTVAAAFGLIWLYMSLSGRPADDGRLWARRLFIFSILTIIVLSVMMSVDSRAPSMPPVVISSNP